jgi:hypothetical protein
VRSEFVFRKPLLCGIATIAMAGCFVTFVVSAIWTSRPNASAFVGAVILSVFVYFFYLLGWQSCVRLVAAGVIVDNLCSRNFIPWHELSRVEGGNGLLIVTRGGQRIGSLAYGGSIIGLFTGNRQARAVAGKIASAQERSVAAGEPNDDHDNQRYRSGVNFQVLPIVIPLGTMKLVAGLSYVLH